MTSLTIYHLSDWHIAFNNDVTYRLESHEVHLSTYNNILDNININNIVNPIIVITGDIFSYKTELRGYDVEDFYKFMKKYSSIAPILCIPGLYDGSIEREIDLVKPLIENIRDNLNPIYYFIDNIPKYITINNIKLCIGAINILTKNTSDFSLYEIFANDYGLEIINNKYDISIGIVYGNIDTKTNTNNKSIISNDFTDLFDIVCCGSIHNYQMYKNCCYSGALFQQNRKESFTKGVGVYFINNSPIYTDKLKYIDTYSSIKVTIKRYLLHIHNNYGHITEIHKDNKIDICSGVDVLYPRSIKIDYINCDKLYINNTSNLMKLKYPNKHVNVNDKTELEQVMKDAAEKSLSTKVENISNIISNYIISFIDDKELIKPVLELHKTISDEFVPELDMYHSRFNISKLEFSNVTIYGINNKVCFDDIKPGSLIGISSKNGQGKSTFINVIIAGLYNTIERGNLTQLIRTGSSGYNISIELKSQLDIGVSNKKINIDKNIHDSNNEDLKTINLDKIHTKKSTIEINKDFTNRYSIIRSRLNKTSNDTLIYNNSLTIRGNDNIKNIVEMIVGDPDICMYTNIAQQKTSYNFLTETNIHQKTILEKFFHLDIINKLKKVVDDLYKEYNIKLKMLNKPSNDSLSIINERINKNKLENEKLLKTINDSEDALNKLRIQKEELLSNRPVINKELLNKDYLAKIEKYISKHNIDCTSEEELWIKVHELQTQIINIDGFKSCYLTDNKSNELLNINTINKDKKIDQKDSINEIINNVNEIVNTTTEMIDSSLNKSTKLIEQVINNLTNDINNYKHLNDRILSDYNNTKNNIDEYNKVIISNSDNEKLSNVDLSDLETKYDNLMKTKPKSEISTIYIKNEIKRLQDLLKNFNIRSNSEPLFSPNCQCCQNNKNLFGITNLDALTTQLHDNEQTNEQIRKENSEREISIKKLSKLIRLKKDLINALDKIKLEENKLDNLNNQSNNINKNITLVNELINVYSSIKTARTNLKVKKMMDQLDDVYKYEKFTITINELENKIDKLSNLITEWRANILQYNRLQIIDEDLIERVSHYESNKKEIEREILVYNTYRNCFNNKNGIQVKLLSLKLPILCETINCYLKSFDVDFQVSIKLDSKNDIEINLVKRGSIEPIKLTAGFQHDLINMLLRVALWKLYEGPLPNFFIFDETFSHADQINLQKTIDFLKSLKKSDSPPQFIIINSHNSDTINNLDHIINIEHNEVRRVSRINNVDKSLNELTSCISDTTPLGEFTTEYLNTIINETTKSNQKNIKSFINNKHKEKLTQNDMLNIVNKKTIDIDKLNERLEDKKNNHYCDILDILIIDNLTCNICNKTFKSSLNIQSHLNSKYHIEKYEKLKIKKNNTKSK